MAARGEVGEFASQIAEGLFRRGENGVRLRDALVGAGAPRGARLHFGPQRFLFGGEPAECGLGIGHQPALAFEVGGELHQPAVQFADAFLGARLLAVERLARDDEPLQHGGGLGLGLAHGGQAGRDLGLARGDVRLLHGAVGDDAHGLVLGALGIADLGVGGEPAQMEQHRLGAAHLAGNVAVAHRLACLGLERRDLRGDLVDDILDALQIVLGCPQPQLGLVAARVQAGNAGRLFEHAAALLGLGLDDLADAALMHQRRRARAGRGVGEHHADVARAHLAAVEAVDRALLALDAPRDFQRLEVVEGRRCLAIGIVDQNPDFGVVARRAVIVAGEDDVVHLGRAHGLVGRLAHHPAQGFDQIRFAAAVGADHSGQARLDLEIGGLDEGFEADQAQPRELHKGVIPSAVLGGKEGRIVLSSRRKACQGVPHRRGE